MSFETRNPAPHTAGRAGMIKGFDGLDYYPSDTASAFNPQDFIARKFRLEPFMARLVCDLSDIGGRAR